MRRRPPRSTRTDTLFPYTTLFRSLPINGGMVMPSWFDIRGMDLDNAADEQQLQRSVEATRALMAREIKRGIRAERIVLAGFSQGGTVALHTALTHPEKLAGLMVLSSFFAASDKLQPGAANRDIPIHVFHGTQDPMAPESLGQQTVAILQSMGYTPQYKTYPMAHAVCAQEIADISAWLRSLLGNH